MKNLQSKDITNILIQNLQMIFPSQKQQMPKLISKQIQIVTDV